MSAKIRLEIEDHVGTISFNRPDVLNALDDEMIHAFRETTEALAANAQVRCVVVRGEGNAFLAGGDVGMFYRGLDELPARSLVLARELHFGILAIARMPKPVIASVQGAVAGAGLSVMAACDLAIAADNARFASAYTKIGVSPDGGGTYFLTRLLGARKAMELMLLSEPFEAPAAMAMGLVNRVVAADKLAAETKQLAHQLAHGPTLAYAACKRLIGAATHNSLEAQLEAEAQAFSRLAETFDMREGVSAFVAKRAAAFKGE
jgi:2-(1,2-epoxy-1,2-dihydrophenyl)acetyl-CoA isomerase